LLHKLKNLPATPGEWEQCANMSKTLPNLDETCELKGKLTVNRVPGVFAVRFTRALYDGSFQQHFNISHRIWRLRFGPKVPRTSMPLEGALAIQTSDRPVHYHYDILCTPVLFVRDGQILERTYEYTPIAVVSPPDPAAGRVPGLFFWYEFVPYTVTIFYRTKSLSAFITATFGVIGGGFALAAWLDRFLFGETSQTVLE
jgi:hypothetical protein